MKMGWSKNVHEERDCPQQLILGLMNRKYCCLLGLDLFLEKLIANGEGAIIPELQIEVWKTFDQVQVPLV